jgi:hypothetical protein
LRVFAFEQLLYAIRLDLGNDDEHLGRGDLLRVFVTDIDDYLVPDSAPELVAVPQSKAA